MKKIYVGIFAVFAIALLGAGLVAAYHGNPEVQGPEYSDERHEEMEQAFDTLDYDAWVILMEESGRHPKVLDMVSEDNFEVFVEVHDAMEDGNMELAHQLRAELGLGQGRMAGGEGVGLKDGSGMQKMNKGSGQGQRMGQGSMNGDCPYN